MDPRLATTIPYIRDIHDFTDPQKAITNHPFIIGYYVLEAVHIWRQHEVRNFKTRKDDLNEKLDHALELQRKNLLTSNDEILKLKEEIEVISKVI